MTGVQRLTPALERAALAFLARSPYENVFLTWLIERDTSNATRAGLHLYLDSDSHVRGVAFFGRQVVIAAADDGVVDAFADRAPAFRFERMIVAPRQIVDRYWSRVKVWHAPPRIVRESQPLLTLEGQWLRGSGDGIIARRARPDEWEIVAANSANMIQHELEYDPRAVSGDFGSNVRQMIARGLWWVGEREGRLCFFCNAGPYSSQTLQLQGIWTPPELRGRGNAARALHGICAQLLAHHPTLSLYVNAFNEPALALYDHVGFRRAGEFATILF
ncbi:MAG: GNAT family N-acetyltransferase [Vulcanimicrobiaceae bacterium]